MPRWGVTAERRRPWRAWLRAIHRDIGYFSVGFTLLYACSGLLLNHIDDWDSNFKASERELTIPAIAADVPDSEAVARVVAATGIAAPTDVYRAGDELHLTIPNGQATVYGESGLVVIQASEPRFLLRIINWLHVNRGKKAWTLIADIYAVLLVYLAVSGLLMIKGRLGLRWRGAALMTAGIAVPALYVALAGGPDQQTQTTPESSASPPPSDRPTLAPTSETPSQ